MDTSDVETIYEQHIKPLPEPEQRQLAKLITEKLDTLATDETQKKHSLLELEGLGEEIWQGIDAQEYVNELRKEWDHRP